MSDPKSIIDALVTTEDAFQHAEGRPEFEPGLDASADADPGAVQIQKACRLLEVTRRLDEVGEYYGAIFEQSFIAIEQTLQGYLIAIAGAEERELRDHTRPYEWAKGQVPIEAQTIERISRLYDQRRTAHYYGTTVTTKEQAHRMRTLAHAVHDHIVDFNPETERFCTCPRT